MLLDRRVYIVDDDAALRLTVRRILTSAGIFTQEFSSGEEFLTKHPTLQTGCILLDVQLPGMRGVEVLSELKRARSPHVVIMLSGGGDIPTAINAIREGALDYVEKPFRNVRLLEAVEQGLDAIRAAQPQSGLGSNGLGTLTDREKQVLLALAEGAPSKVIAHQLGLSPRTVEAHRASIARKLKARNAAHALVIAKSMGLIG